MPTYGRHTGRGTATAYPVVCAMCGVLWPRSAMRRDGQGNLICPDEGRGLDAKTLDRLNARVRPLKQKGPSDGLTNIKDPTPASILGDDLHSWYRCELAEVEERDGFVWKLQNLGGNGDLVITNRPGLRWSSNVFSGRPSVMSGSPGWVLASEANSTAEITGRPYFWAVAALSSTTSTADGFLFGVINAAGASLARLYADTQGSGQGFRAIMLTETGVEDIFGPDLDTEKHLFECGFTDSVATRFLVDGTSYAGSHTSAMSGTAARVVLGSSLASWVGPFAEGVISYSVPSAAVRTKMRAYFAARYPELSIA